MGFALWHAGDDDFDRCTLVPTADGWRLQGEARRTSATIAYTLDVDGAWVTRRLAVRARIDGAERGLAVEHDGLGEWTVDGRPAEDLRGCLDVQLDFTPAALTALVRRLGLHVGREAEVAAAHVRLPGLDVDRDVVWLHHQSASRWDHRVDGRTWAVHLGPSGLVQEHEAGWTAVALG